MSARDPQGLNPWVDARGGEPYPLLLPNPRTSVDERTVRFLGPAVRVRRGPRGGFLLVAAVLTAALVLGGFWWMSTSPVFGPPSGLEEAEAPLGAPPPVPAGGGAFAFSSIQPDGSGPVTYSPCRPIHYVVRADGGPANADQLIHTAVESISAATGLQFVDDGATQEAPSADRKAYQPDAYGRRWAPVLVTWSTPEETPELDGDVAGIGGSAAVTRAGRSVYVTGSITLDGGDIGALAAVPATQPTAFGIVVHEFAHLVGLDHIDDPTQLMYPSTSPTVSQLGSGDLAGLAALGSGACAPHV
ncbi:matrixin family metalloprotease [uncultured Cellulomonas sp.]|uniref:matrixin family metalloprotease n=1 Tax=uncultured Cellulomonas sp. TaxID=189682 RepID=UPI0028E73FB9|nr:matrixin family metalloprotease [uncultured Cellulomonas sp.]